MRRTIWASCFFLASLGLFAVHAQNQPSPIAGNDKPAIADYPKNRAGIFIQGSEWTLLQNQFPIKTKAAHSLAAGLSYGLVPAKVVAEYAGDHAPTRIDMSQPFICVCRFSSIPGAPALVRLHPKKGVRELDGGRMTVLPVVGGSRIADANKSDLVPADVTEPEQGYWLIRPQSPLEPGEYALMLGTQNISIFPFSVPPPSSQSARPN